MKNTCKCGQPGCLAHEVIDEAVQIPGFTSKNELNKSHHDLIVFTAPLSEATYGKDELSPAELAVHPGPFLLHWRPRE